MDILLRHKTLNWLVTRIETIPVNSLIIRILTIADPISLKLPQYTPQTNSLEK